MILLLKFYLHVGAKGPKRRTAGLTQFAYNGGGAGIWASDSQKSEAAGGGGTDVRVGGDTLYHRIIVAGGGCGGDTMDSTPFYGGNGGGIEGRIGDKLQGQDAKGGTQTQPGIGQEEYGGTSTFKTHSGLFGYGGYGDSTLTCGWGGAGGSSGDHCGGVGGYGFVLNKNSQIPSEYEHKTSKYFFIHPFLADGVQSIPSPGSSAFEIGHSVNGSL